VILPVTDGIDHINIYSKGKTPLGRWLSNFSYSPIIIPDHGDFISIEGYWYWLGCEEDSLRYLYGFNAKKVGSAIEKTIERDNFKDLIRRAIDIKLKSNKSMLHLLYKSTLPLCHYYVFGDKTKDAGCEWVVEHIDNRRKLLKEAWNT
jgi:hypothetical protein